MTSARFFAVDPSLTCSGWALFRLPSERLLAVGKIRSLPSAHPLAHRLDDLQRKITGVMEQLELGANDVLACEAPTTMRDPRAAFAVEQVRSIFEAVARDQRVRVPGRIHPRSVQYDVIGMRGKQHKREIVKGAAVVTVQKLYGGVLEQMGFDMEEKSLRRHQDIVDAILIGTYGVSQVAQSNRSGVPLETLFSQNQKSSSRRFKL